MIIPPKRVLEGVVETLEKVIIRELSSSYAKGQAFAAVALLQGLSMRLGRVERLYAVENEELRALLRLFMSSASRLPRGRDQITSLTRRIRVSSTRRTLKADYEDLRKQNIWLRSLLNEMLECLEMNRTSSEAKKVRRRVQRHMKHQVERELQLGVESRMREVSKG